jgi:hypothetical protein
MNPKLTPVILSECREATESKDLRLLLFLSFWRP